MIKRFVTWLGDRFKRDSDGPDSDAQGPRVRPVPPRVRPRPETAKRRKASFSTEVAGEIEDGGPGKNVLIRNKYVREDTGTHDTLKIVDDSLLESDDESGADPYNTGQFDRSKSWNLRTRK